MMQVELEQEHIDLIIKTMREKKETLDILLKNQDGLEAETIRDMLIETREINNAIRELQHFAVSSDNNNNDNEA